MNGQYDISIIIPCHQLELYISKLLYSFHMLDLDDVQAEFIFVLDDCTDNTEEIIHNLMEDFDYRIIFCNHHSCGFARNEGLDIAQGEFIWFVDGDDWIINPAVIKDALRLLRENDLDLFRLPFVSNFFKGTYYSMVWQYIYRRTLIGDLRFRKKQPHEDVDFTDKIFASLKNQQLYDYIIPSYFYNYNRPGSNITRFIQGEKI